MKLFSNVFLGQAILLTSSQVLTFGKTLINFQIFSIEIGLETQKFRCSVTSLNTKIYKDFRDVLFTTIWTVLTAVNKVPLETSSFVIGCWFNINES